MSDRPVTEADFQAYVDGRLTPESAAEISQRLLSHPEEARRVAAYRAQNDALRAALASIVDEPLPAALDLRLRHRSLRRWTGLRSAAVAASAAGLLFLGGAGGWTLRGWNVSPSVGTAALAREAASSYAVYASDTARPVELAATQRDALDGWFSERLARPIRAPDLRSAGLTLIGGRLVATEHGPAGLYLYRDSAGRRMALYVRPMDVDGTDRMTARREGGIAGWTWADEGLGFGIFGTAPSVDLHAAADMVRSQFQRT
ncbi:MAG: anti-sigma factor [Sphingomonas sp.]|jgi:anti-sigma factor RsiW|uniref:anti-sigma factor family protein n=1 Tax=Sphingomonas sp. TaxID=28214 RepID=UPI003566EC15